MIALVSCVLFPGLAHSQETPKKTPGKKRGAEAIDQKDCKKENVTIDVLERWIRALAEERIIYCISQLGLNFPVTEENLKTLQDKGATKEILDKVREFKAKEDSTNTPPPPPTTGTLYVECMPAGCEITLNGELKDSKEHGIWKIEGIPLGKLQYVAATKKGYTGYQQNVQFDSTDDKRLSFELPLANNTREGWGKGLFSKMDNALGGEAVIPVLDSITAEGTAMLKVAGRSSEWDTRMQTAQTLSEIGVEHSEGAFELWCRAESCKPAAGGGFFSKKKTIKGAEADELKTLIGLFRRNQFAALMGRLRTQKGRTLLSDRSPEDPTKVLRVAVMGSSYEITLGTEFLPLIVKLISGSDAGIEIDYSGFEAVGKSMYPKVTSINGNQVHFTKVTAGASLKEKDFPR